MHVCVKSLYLMICCISGKNGITPPGLEPGLSDCQSDALPTELQRETSFHLLCIAFVVSVSLHNSYYNIRRLHDDMAFFMISL